MILPARNAARVPDTAGPVRRAPAGFDALLDASEPPARIALPEPPRPPMAARKETPPKDAAGAEERSESEASTEDPPSNGLMFLDPPEEDRNGRPRLFKGDNPAPAPASRDLGGLHDTLDRMDVQLLVTRMTAAQAATRMVTPLPADPIRDLGEVFELPRPAERSTDPAPTSPGTGAAVDEAPASPDAGSFSGGEGQSHGETNPGDTGMASAVLVAPTAHGFTLLPSEVPAPAPELEPSLAADRAAAASMLLDAQAGVADGITVHLDDVLGRWEVDVLRRGNELGLVLRGDANLHDAVRQAAGELRERLRSEGMTLNQLKFESLDRAEADRAPVRPAADAASAGFGQAGHERGGRREEAPPWPGPRALREARAASPLAPRRGGLDLSA